MHIVFVASVLQGVGQPAEQSISYSATGARTRVARVRAEYPNQLDYSGFCNLFCLGKVKFYLVRGAWGVSQFCLLASSIWLVKKIQYTSRFAQVILAQGPC